MLTFTFLKELKRLEDLVDNNEDAFMAFHFKMSPDDLLMGLTGIYFGSESIKVYYILNDGMHIADSITWEHFNKWRATL